MVQLACLCSGLAFVTASAALMLAGAGVPHVVAALMPAALAGAIMYAASRALLATPPADAAAVEALRSQVGQLETAASALRHDLRGVLSPALMVADRLVNNPDPAVRRAGDAVVRSIDRATALLSASKASADHASDSRNSIPT